ncbi:MAG: nicotinate phosphoribosyltransferase [Candidatus Micrarchaeia archaeon]
MGDEKAIAGLFRDAAMQVDLYELTMAEAYFREGMDSQAVFDITIRESRLRGYYVACGMLAAREFAKAFRFGREHEAYLSSLGFGDDFISHLVKMAPHARIESVKDGEAVFAGEPILKVRAPLGMAQMLESGLLNIVGFQTMIATKAARVCSAAGKRQVVEFGLRRAQGLDAGAWAAYASYVGGCAGTSDIFAGRAFGLPVFGTVGHSYVMAHKREEEAFEKWAQYSKSPTLLIDTYDTIRGAHNAAALAKKIRDAGKSLSAVRIDSRDAARESAQVRKILDAAGLFAVKIIISGGMDEFAIEKFDRDGGVADSFGVGTSMVVSSDMPSLDIAYKLAEIAGSPVMKKTAGKESLPGDKQVFRRIENGRFAGDTIGLEGEEIEGAEILITPWEGGGWEGSAGAAREYARGRLAMLPEGVARISGHDKYEVGISKGLAGMRQ